MTPFQSMLVVSTLVGLATGLGAIPILFGARVSHRTYDAALGLAGGIMVAASVFGLIIPGTEQGALWEVMLGVTVGGFGLLAGNRIIPHVHGEYRRWRGHAEGIDLDGLDDRVRRAVLVGGAITIHNAPEGLAMGIAYASGLEEVALVLAVVIALQNVPDGFAFAVPVNQSGVSSGKVLLYTTLSGTVPQVMGSVFGFALVGLAAGIFPVAAGFAAGAMLAVVLREMVPSSHGHGYADAATAAFIVGFVLLVVVDAAVG
ncbi:ZIP family metal transporter [Halolamina sp. CBA1230]|uniref:ZIP family metal transporter n=1 Tax=Halolamina sp. CBA1230 TaxID=1853690 RepID=UPI0009A1FE74|nr:ZIP family metal transporter [Halolamina sp. CBA1230]QKY19610.1 ZIP family metal transporter [Halolamina sp. CBA1230]